MIKDILPWTTARHASGSRIIHRLADAAVQVDAQDGEEIVSFGKTPWQIVKGDVTVTIRNQAMTAAVVLDANGMSAGTVATEATGGGRRFKFPSDAMYVVLD